MRAKHPGGRGNTRLQLFIGSLGGIKKVSTKMPDCAVTIQSVTESGHFSPCLRARNFSSDTPPFLSAF